VGVFDGLKEGDDEDDDNIVLYNHEEDEDYAPRVRLYGLVLLKFFIYGLIISYFATTLCDINLNCDMLFHTSYIDSII